MLSIEWNVLDLHQWQNLFASVRRSTLPQSYHYARVVCPLRGQKPRWGLIKIDGKNAGLVQILEASILHGVFHALIIDRGPLWFDGFNTRENFNAFCTEINKQFPKRFGRKRRFIPEFENVENIAGFTKLPSAPYETVWIDLTKDMDTIRADMHKKWRNILSKAERSTATTEWDDVGRLSPWFLTQYISDKLDKEYFGVSLKVLKSMINIFKGEGHVLIGRSMYEGEYVAGVIIFCHGASATYQAGFTNEKGRAIGAHNLLLWETCKTLKAGGIKDFDLGGINDEKASGVKKFKENMGGQSVRIGAIYM